jgi:hypothetical protein
LYGKYIYFSPQICGENATYSPHDINKLALVHIPAGFSKKIRATFLFADTEKELH